MREPKPIYCPKCNDRVATYDGKGTINVVTKCRRCNKRVVYHADTGITDIKDVPPRNTSSGMSFC